MKISNNSGLLFLAFLVILTLSACRREEQSAAVDANTENRHGVSERTVRFRSFVDAYPLEFNLYFPEDYDFSHQRPLIVVWPDMELPGEWRAGQALVVRLKNNRPEGCPTWLLHEDIRSSIDYLSENFPVMKEQVYLAGEGIPACEFVCMNPSRFAGVYLQFGDTAFDKWEEFPLRNLLNIPVYLQKSNYSPVASELEQRLLDAGARYLNAPDFLLASTPSENIVLAFAWLSAQEPAREHIIWEGSRVMPSEVWWLRVDSIARGGHNGLLSAKYIRESNRIFLYTRNLNAIAINTGWERFKDADVLEMEIDRCIFEIPNTHGWVRIKKNADGVWDVASKRQRSAKRADYRKHGLRSVMSGRVLVVSGTANDERAEEWKKAAEDFADEWKSLTGSRPDVRQDRTVSPEMLENRNIIFFGSPADNLLTEALLDDDASFLRRLYGRMDGKRRVSEDLTCVTLYPDDRFSQVGGLAAIVLANDSSKIKKSWKPLLEASEADFVFHGDFGTVSGYYSDDWQIDE